MADEVLTIFRRWAMRLLLRRCLEAVAVALTAGALAAAVLELAWTLAWHWPVVGGVLCIVPIAVGAAVAMWKPMRGFLAIDKSLATVTGGLCVGAGAVSLMMLLGGTGLRTPRETAPLTVLPAAVIAGAAAAIRRRMTPVDAAVYLDAKC